ncbi:sideroflexin-4 isoform X2 [Lepisosteus oculatus]|uniref:sideroflexin-4 isoform X2 n=1 Tax=Lepisosteus oculatus TaxID=7918 RepID=UPI00074047D6|nr:PREDICTED: sideroflexin-4 isoform X2 [Lepisosteus oculatus]
MDHHNLQYWRKEGQTFIGRILNWVDILDPVSLLASDDRDAWKLSLASVHSDTGNVIPLVFRPPAFLPIAAPLVLATLIPHRGMKPALFWQFLFHSYSAGFNYANRNTTVSQENKMSLKEVLLIAGSVSFATCAGAIPQYMMKHYGMKNPTVQLFFRSVLPVPLFALLSAFSLFVVRSEEFENGIQVFDSNGNAVGMSQKAGLKAVTETAASRAVLIGTTTVVPNLLISFLRRTKFIQGRPLLLAPLRHITAALVFGLMIPVSFSLFPHAAKVQNKNLEKEIQALTADTHLYYHRGL